VHCSPGIPPAAFPSGPPCRPSAIRAPRPVPPRVNGGSTRSMGMGGRPRWAGVPHRGCLSGRDTAAGHILEGTVLPGSVRSQGRVRTMRDPELVRAVLRARPRRRLESAWETMARACMDSRSRPGQPVRGATSATRLRSPGGEAPGRHSGSTADGGRVPLAEFPRPAMNCAPAAGRAPATDSKAAAGPASSRSRSGRDRFSSGPLQSGPLQQGQAGPNRRPGRHLGAGRRPRPVALGRGRQSPDQAPGTWPGKLARLDLG